MWSYKRQHKQVTPLYAPQAAAYRKKNDLHSLGNLTIIFSDIHGFEQ